MNKQSSVGLTEELLTNLINLVALEYHLRITYEKYYSLLYVKKVSEPHLVADTNSKLQFTMETLERATEQRRAVMSVLYELGTEDANQDMWCSVKHSAVQMITMFEAWQVDLNNATIENLYHKSVELFNVVVSSWLGYYPQPCSACLGDVMKSQEEFNSMRIGDLSADEITDEDVMKRAEEVFGSVPNALLEEGEGQ